VEIRPAQPGDVPAIARLLNDLGYPSSSREVRERLGSLDSCDRVFVTDGGLIALHRIPRVAEGGALMRITALVVAPERRGQGVGRALLHTAEETARQWGCDLIEVSSGRRAERDAAHAFYSAMGFEDSVARSVRYWKRLH
jgi:GNAT superfamily N-acetyltransferase